MDRPGTCIIFDKEYNIENSSCHLGPVPHQKNIILTSEASVHILFFWWLTGPYTAIWPSVPWTICYIHMCVCVCTNICILFRQNMKLTISNHSVLCNCQYVFFTETRSINLSQVTLLKSRALTMLTVEQLRLVWYTIYVLWFFQLCQKLHTHFPTLLIKLGGSLLTHLNL